MNSIIDEARPQVPALAAITRPLGMTKVREARCYVCTVQAGSAHRTDGKKLAFVHGFMRTDIQQDIDYMEHEIAEGNQYFRHATPQEIEAYDMRTDPRGTLTKNITETLTPQIRAQVEGELRVELEAKIRAELLAAADGAKIPDESAKHPDPANIKPDASAVNLGAVDKLAALKKQVVPVAGATLVHNKPLITPVSSADIGGAAVPSGK